MTDFTIIYEGTVVRFQPNNDRAYEWLLSNCQSDEWQWLGRTLVVEHRFAGPFHQILLDEGFTIG